MFATIEQALDVYKQEVKDYLTWFETLNLPKEGTIELKLGILDPIDYDKFMAWQEKMASMVKVLGLTEKEEAEIDSELGVIA
ncbi:MAG: hypothetical protein NT068_01090 [Candidatus Nomurabacteria bacterium]|nr:hypothetical protein [Candidatus Nomurabacteria bacterium]